ncbi:hypothetical protein D3C81_991770 [compost metagenome]
MLNVSRIFRVLRLFGSFFRQRQALAVDHFLQQLHAVIQSINMPGGVIALFLQQILQGGVGFQAFALQINLRIEQRLFGCQHH